MEDREESRVERKDLLAAMIAQFIVLVPIIILLAVGMGVVLWVVLYFWNG